MTMTAGARTHLVILLLLGALTTFHVPLAQPLEDAFQEGEYAAFGFLAQTQPGFRMPVLIHGQLDVLPSRAAALLCRAEAQMVCVRGINMGLQFVAVVLFIALLAGLAGLGSVLAVVAGGPAVAMLWLYNGPTERIADAHQGTPSLRDLFVLAGLLVMARLCRRIDRGDGAGLAAGLVGLGVLAAVGQFWAYNRGLALDVVVGVFTLGLCLVRRSVRPITWVIAGGVAGLVAVVMLGGMGLVEATLFDIGYWSRNGGMWHLPLVPVVAVPVGLLALFVLARGWPVAVAAYRAGRAGRGLMLAVLAVVFALYIAQSFNRPDLLHVRWVMWPAALLLAMVIRAWAAPMLPAVAHRDAMRLATLLLVAGAAIEFYGDSSILRFALAGLGENIAAAGRPAPSDRDLAGPDLARVADVVAASGGCTFAANNAGIVHLLSRRPPCSRFAFGIYVAADQQDAVIAELEAARPGVILWESAAWWSHIDQRDFPARAPVLAGWITAHYPVRTVIGPHVLLSR